MVTCQESQLGWVVELEKCFGRSERRCPGFGSMVLPRQSPGLRDIRPQGLEMDAGSLNTGLWRPRDDELDHMQLFSFGCTQESCHL